MTGVRNRNEQDWNRILHHAQVRDNPFAKALAAYCYSSSTMKIVEEDRNAATTLAAESLTYLQQMSHHQGCKFAQYYLAVYCDMGLGV
jgi:hypothetical protein